MNNHIIKTVSFDEAKPAIMFVREQVFINEQQVPVELEWDGLDETALHLLAVDSEGKPVATCRMLEDGHIGRMAVLQGWRGQGIGSTMLQRLVEIARDKKLPGVYLSAQVKAIDFYKKYGFTLTGEIYMDAGIPHRDMHRELD